MTKATDVHKKDDKPDMSKSLSPEELSHRLRAFDNFELSEPVSLTDDEIRTERLKERFDVDI
ncbi:MAG: hypothetical protein LBB42_01895 [Coriobacteriales bacterium]|jgi:hypothetical protein|nr:hypothetical protein [Coriobacteriales bacterium]